MVEFIRQDFNNDFIPDSRLIHTIYLTQLQHGGFPFKGNDLSEDEWMWLSYFKNARERFSLEKYKR